MFLLGFLLWGLGVFLAAVCVNEKQKGYFLQTLALLISLLGLGILMYDAAVTYAGGGF